MECAMNGRVALITGGSRGLGHAMAKRFADSGATIAIAARRADVLEETRREIAEATGARVESYACDVGDRDQAEELVDRVTADLGRLDILVNNAGTSRRGPFLSMTDEDWQGDLDLKLFAAIRLIRKAVPGMKERRWGRILNILNTGAKAPPAEGAPTAVSRAAGLAMTKVLAGELAPHNILVNALCTGRIVSDQWLNRHQRDDSGADLQTFLAAQASGIPMGRLGTAEEYANMACFLASDAGTYITGTAINVDGGLCPVP